MLRRCPPENELPNVELPDVDENQQDPRTPAKVDGSLRCYQRKPRVNKVNRPLEGKEARKQDAQDITRKRSISGGDCDGRIPLKTGSSKEEEENDDGGPAMLILPTLPKKEVLSEMVAMSNYAYALTGTAVKGQLGPVIGLMDIGESDKSYIFRVALPGVKREDGAFRCEVESSGKVLIKGETVTGEKQVTRFTQVFEMQTQNLCPPGPFTISFRLPGSVDHRKFKGSFSTNGVLEGVVMKAGAESAAATLTE